MPAAAEACFLALVARSFLSSSSAARSVGGQHFQLGAFSQSFHSSGSLRARPPLRKDPKRYRMDASTRYTGWSHEQLVDRIAALELSVSQSNAAKNTEAKALAKQDARKATDEAVLQEKLLSTTVAHNEQEQKRPDEASPGPSRKALKRMAKKATRLAHEGEALPATLASATRTFDVSAQPCRKVALRFSYDGAPYSGLAAQNTKGDQLASSLPTVEGELWKALCDARLVDTKGGMEGAGWARCGRTDRGVSAAGQVVSLWIRSRRVDQWEERREQRRIYLEKNGMAEELEGTGPDGSSEAMHDAKNAPSEALGQEASKPSFKPAEEELLYVATLNRMLPPTIRLQAWSPVRSDFSSRFDCRYRHYKYFFTAGAPAALQSLHPDAQAAAGWSHAGSRLDIEAMRDAASRLLGEHDFRNLCKVDASKQIDNFRRRIDGASVDVVQSGWRVGSRDKSRCTEERISDEAEGEEMYVLNLRGTAFLYHQVRHIVAVLFMVGARLERPSVIDELLNTEYGAYAADRLALRAKGILAGVDAERDSPGRRMLPDSTATCFTGQTAADKERETLHAAVAVNGSSQAGGAFSSTSQASSEDVAEIGELYKHLAVLDGKPSYEMAADRPLVLWDCGFKAEDVQWRAGPYDGPLTAQAVREIAKSPDRTTATTTMHLHSQWVRSAIQAELNRHFLLAAPSPASGGVLPASTLFEDARSPFLAPPVAEPSPPSPGRERRILPLGDGTSKAGGPGYIPLSQRPRDESAEQKNQRWLEGKGKRRAEAKGMTAMQLAKGPRAV